jgi:hypothetical protein
MKQIPPMQYLRFYGAGHYRIAGRLQFDHVVCRANSTVRQCLFALSPIRWARDALRFLREGTEFRHDEVYFICTCMQLESMVQALPKRKPRTLLLPSLVVGGVRSLKIRGRFLGQTKQIFVQPWHSHEDRLPLEYIGKLRVPWKNIAQQLVTRTLATRKRWFRQLSKVFDEAVSDPPLI